MNKHTDQQYIEFDPIGPEEAEISCRTVKIAKARKEHACFFGQSFGGDNHQIKVGERYRHERALVDGDFWGQWKCCLGCIDKQIAELNGDDEGDDE